MSIKISSLVWEYYPAGGCELLTALAYADHAHDDGTNVSVHSKTSCHPADFRPRV